MLEKTVSYIAGGLLGPAREMMVRGKSIVSLVDQYAPEVANLNEEEMKIYSTNLRMTFHQHGFEKTAVARSFALIREVADRTIGLRHFDVQLMGAWAILKGMIAEMETGEGKTLTATLAAGTVALAGIPVHVISVNDYLTERDSATMEPVYQALGLTVGCVIQDTPPPERRAIYQSDITYSTNKVIVFDYLRDRMAIREMEQPLLLQADALCTGGSKSARLLQRGLCFAIVDEADSILIDEARTPLIISGIADSEAEENFMRQASDIADELIQGSEYDIELAERKIVLKDIGKESIRLKTEPMGALWKSRIRREDIIKQALTAKHLFKEGEHYLVKDDKVQIIDEFTGRVMPDRSWERGLHQLVEIKEGCEVTGQRETLARISYQSFFRRYLSLGGMTGTANEVKRELWDVYGLSVVHIPTNRPMIRKYLPDKIYRTEDEKWGAVVDQIKCMHKQKRPVLVGTRSVAASEYLSKILTKNGNASHQVLNAWKIEEEADIVAKAGIEGAVTIATNMAGRGTDIKLGKGVKEMQGLHVILTERHEAGRIDRQLAGRCGRQGDPGSIEAMLSMEDPILLYDKSLIKLLAMVMMRVGLPRWKILGKKAILHAQKKTERKHARIRHQLLKMDENTQNLLSFSGKPD